LPRFSEDERFGEEVPMRKIAAGFSRIIRADTAAVNANWSYVT